MCNININENINNEILMNKVIMCVCIINININNNDNIINDNNDIIINV